MKLVLIFALSLAACAAPPVLTDAQKLQVREAQVQVAMLDAQKARLEAQYKDAQAAIEKAAAALDAVVARVTPKGYVLQLDLKLIREVKKK